MILFLLIFFILLNFLEKRFKRNLFIIEIRREQESSQAYHEKYNLQPFIFTNFFNLKKINHTIGVA